MLHWSDIIWRLASAAAVGTLIGLDRDLRGKPTGVRTMGVVSVGAALIVLATQYPTQDSAAASRVMQGIITGIGFLGAGVILRNPRGGKVHGLTTAATIWLTACFGAACGAGAWLPVVTAAVLVALILTAGRSLERAAEQESQGENEEGYDWKNESGP